MVSPLPLFPYAQQAQIIRANQRDLYHVSSLREQTESVLRSWLGTRWLARWDSEVDLVSKLVYYCLTTGRATQTLGEEYTDIWQHHALATHPSTPPSPGIRTLLILLPALPSYVLARWGRNIRSRWETALRSTLFAFEVLSEVNLAVFYLKGAYYDVVKRMLGVRQISSVAVNPQTRPPSYALLGVLLGIRLLHRLITFIRATSTAESDPAAPTAKGRSKPHGSETYLDERAVSTLIVPESEDAQTLPAESDVHTALHVPSIPPVIRAARVCTLCLEERTISTSTECGHLFCWSCIVGWGREKAECPLCRQGLKLERLLPVYNL